MPKLFAFIVDPMEKMIPAEDTTFAFMLAASAKGHHVVHVLPQNVAYKNGKVYLYAERIEVFDQKDRHFQVLKKNQLEASECQAIFIRSNPPFNEAFEMRRYLIEEHNIPANRILVEPMAEHSTTNLRNAGRMMQRAGMQRALITSSPQAFGQSFYFQTEFPFYAYATRATAELGYALGKLQRIDNHHTEYLPSPDVDLVTLDDGQNLSSDP